MRGVARQLGTVLNQLQVNYATRHIVNPPLEMLRCERKSEKWSECSTYIGRVPAKVGSEDTVELTNEIQLRKEHGWYRDRVVKQQSVNKWIVVRNRKKAIGISIHSNSPNPGALGPGTARNSKMSVSGNSQSSTSLYIVSYRHKFLLYM